VYYLDTLGEKAAIEARLPTNILATINCFLAQQNPPRVVSSLQILNTPQQQEASCGACVNELACRLCEGADVLFGMGPFERSSLLRIKQAKEIFDFVLSL